jgi:hypothetical protein
MRPLEEQGLNPIFLSLQVFTFPPIVKNVVLREFVDCNFIQWLVKWGFKPIMRLISACFWTPT